MAGPKDYCEERIVIGCRNEPIVEPTKMLLNPLATDSGLTAAPTEAIEPPLVVPASNVQLYNLLFEEGWPAEDVSYVHNAYKSIAKLFSSSFRANWKPFLSHLVATAAIVSWDTRDRNRVCAALAHSALELGAFPRRIAWFGSKSTELRKMLGRDVCSLVEEYQARRWESAYLETSDLNNADFPVVHVKLADTLDDLLDELALVGSSKAHFVTPDNKDLLARLTAQARKIDAPRLAEAYEVVSRSGPAARAIIEPGRGSFQLKPSTLL